MSSVNNIVLSICIPTYNRAVYLERLLTTLECQIDAVNKNGNIVEVFILDNSSDDDTKTICLKYVEKCGKWLRYIRHAKNLGMDGNFEAAYNVATGHFFWMLGDDEVICKDGIKCLVDFLQKHRDAALLNVKSVFIAQNEICRKNAEELEFGTIKKYRVYNKPYEFLKSVGIWVTFISGIIVNKKVTKIKAGNNPKIRGTNLFQLSWVFSALECRHGYFVDIKHPIVIAEPENSGGYNLFKVFSENFTKIAGFYFDRDTKIMRTLKRSSLYFVIPFLYNSSISKNFSVIDAKSILDSAYLDVPEYKYLFRFLLDKKSLGFVLLNLFKLIRKAFCV